MLHWLGVLGLVALGFAAEFASEVWGIHYTNSITGRYSRLSEAEISAKIWRARKWGALLFLLTQVDIGGASYGPSIYLPIATGAAFGFWFGAGTAMRKKWERLNGGKPEPGDSDED